MQMSDLLPCPMCGAKAEFDYDDSGYHWVFCTGCGVSSDTARHFEEDCHIELAKQWNTRLTPPGMIKTEESHQRVIDAVAGARKSWAKQATLPDGYVLVPLDPTEALLYSMAVRYDHGLGCPGYYDQPMFKSHITHQQRLESTIRTMRQLHEEVVGAGFYKAQAAGEE